MQNERIKKQLGWKNEKAGKSSHLSLTNAKKKKLRFKERAVKKAIIAKDPAHKRLMEKERKAARKVRKVAKKATRKERRLKRLHTFKVRKIRENEVERVRMQEQAASEVIRKYAHKLGVKTTPTVHFRLHRQRKHTSGKESGKESPAPGKQRYGKESGKEPPAPGKQRYVQLHYATKQMVNDARRAFTPNQAQHDASTAVKHVLDTEPVEEDATSNSG